MNKKQKRKSILEERLYITPTWLAAPPRKLPLGEVNLEQMTKWRTATSEAIEINRKRYEAAHSAYTRTVLEARKLYPEDHEVMKVLRRSVPGYPPKLEVMFQNFTMRWAKERDEQAKKNKANAQRRAAYARSKLLQQQQSRPQQQPIALLPARCKTSIEAERKQFQAAGIRDRAAHREPYTVLHSTGKIELPGPAGYKPQSAQMVLLPNVPTETDLSGVYG